MKLHFSVKNLMLYLIIIVVTLTVTLVAFASKAVKYQDESGNVVLTVRKREFKVSSQTSGTLAEVRTDVGQHVKKGDILAIISNQVLDRQIAKLQELSATNTSASVQLIAYQTEKEAQTVYAPTDGIVAEVAAVGESVSSSQKIGTIYSDSGVQLVGTFTIDEYTGAQGRLGALNVTVRRLNAEYAVTYVGLGQQVNNIQEYESNVILYFTPANQDDAANLLQDEKVILRLSPKPQGNKPIDYIVGWYRQLVGK